jgi:hypothetical protein
LEAVGDDPLLAAEHERLRAAPVDDETDLPAMLRVDEALLVDQQRVPEAVRCQPLRPTTSGPPGPTTRIPPSSAVASTVYRLPSSFVRLRRDTS